MIVARRLNSFLELSPYKGGEALNKKSWLIPYEILKKYLETHKHLFKNQR